MFRRLSMHLAIMCWVFPLPLAMATDTVPAQTIHIEQGFHLTSPEGSDVEVGPGDYQVDRAAQTELWLISVAQGTFWRVQARSTKHEEALEQPEAHLVSDQEDIRRVVLLLPGGEGLEAVGSISGVQTRWRKFTQFRQNPKELGKVQQEKARDIPLTQPKKELGKVQQEKARDLTLTQPKYRLPVLFVRLADNDGSNESTLTKNAAIKAISDINRMYRRNEGFLQFFVDPDSDFSGHVRDTAKNHNCLLASGQTAETIRANTTYDLNGDGKVGDDHFRADANVLCDLTGPHGSHTRRNAFAWDRPHTIVVFFRSIGEKLKWVKTDMPPHWELSHKVNGFSSHKAAYVVMPPTINKSSLLGHEIAHYLNVHHTHGGSKPKSIAQAAEAMAKYMTKHNVTDGTKVFDGDSRQSLPYPVYDTPPDPGAGVFIETFGKDKKDYCAPNNHTVNVPVTVNNHTTIFPLRPDRANLASYWSCFPRYLSKGQLARVRNALETGNRSILAEMNKAKGLSTCYGQSSQARPRDPLQQIQNSIRRIVQCFLLFKRPLPGEIEKIYANPADRRPQFRNARVIKQLRINLSKEQQFIDKLVDARYEIPPE